MKNIIFLFALPRSGSTLLQRILIAHKKINSVSEPWILLPILYTLKPKGSLAEYNSIICYSAIQDFIKELANKEEDYLQAIKIFALSLYCKANKKNADYFLDKTPRYYNIIPEIAKVFPDAKFIFLFRNPLAVMSSIFKTWHHGRLIMGDHYQDLYYGPKLLINGYNLLKEKSIKVNYEKLVNNPENELSKILEYLEVDFDKAIVKNFYLTGLNGKMGDPEKYKYQRVEAKLAEEWKKFFNTKFRQKYAEKYLNYLSDEMLDDFGYDKNELLASFQPAKKNWRQLIIDRFDLTEEKLKFILFRRILKKYFSKFYERY